MWFTVLLMIFTVMAASCEGDYFVDKHDLFLPYNIIMAEINNVIILSCQR